MQTRTPQLVVVAIPTDVVDSLEEELSRESLYAFWRQVLIKNNRAHIRLPLPLPHRSGGYG